MTGFVAVGVVSLGAVAVGFFTGEFMGLVGNFVGFTAELIALVGAFVGISVKVGKPY